MNLKLKLYYQSSILFEFINQDLIKEKKMYMHTNKKIIICKFHLKNKCQSGEKCKFRHVSVNELNDIFTKFKDLKQENTILKRVVLIMNLNR
jgi:hypothetical protein